ncbi:MAG: amino acid adenylation domain-containing protein, partial [Clostridia bacterium]|nr:amino acid adenylation domain-containing protein [Clostridia bacterium]
EYMIPSYMGQIDMIPVNANGKLDRKALPELEATSTREYVAPRNETEEILCQLFTEILIIERVGIKDDFFEMGGHSLRATRLVNSIEEKTGCRIALKDVFANPTPQMLAELVLHNGADNYVPIPIAEKHNCYPMTSTQKRMYVMSEIDGGGITYNIPAALEMKGQLDLEKLQQVFSALISRHEALRTSFTMKDGADVQVIADNADCRIEFEYVDEADEKAKKRLLADFVRPFDLSVAPLIRMKVVKIGKEDNLLMFDTHHIVSDGMSATILLEEFMKLYNGENLPDLRVQYKDYSEWVRTVDNSSQKAYWLEQFSEEAPVLDMPLDFSRPQYQSFNGRTHTIMFGKEILNSIRAFAKETGTTEYMVLISALMVTLSKYSRQEDIVVGTPVSGRTHRDTESMIGMFVNTLAMRGKPERQKTFRQFLMEMKEQCIRAYENQDYPFKDLIEAVEVKRDLSRNPLFDVMFVLQNNEKARGNFKNVNVVSAIELDSNIAKFDFTVTAIIEDEGIRLKYEYCTDLYKLESIERLSKHYCQALKNLIATPDAMLSNVSVLTEKEGDKVVYKFNKTMVDYPDTKTLVDLFEEQVEKTPNNIAVVFGKQKLTYAELNTRANQIANRLRALGVKPDDFVAMLTERSIEMVIGVYAILKAGAAYVPINTIYPDDRIQFILEDCQPKCILTYDATVPMETDVPIIDLGDYSYYFGSSQNLPKVNKPTDLAYVIYTSGTTGKPKGAMIEHKNVVRLLFNDSFQFDFSSEDVWTMFHSYGFDFSVWEMYGATLYGGKLVVVSNDTSKDVEEFMKLINDERVTVLNQVPSSFYNLLAYDSPTECRHLRYLIFGGESLAPSRLKEFKENHPQVKIINMYGITETTVHVTYKEITEKEIRTGVDNIGNAIPTLSVYMMNGMELCGIGMPGELCVAGEGVARGYLNRPELTAKKFIDNPFGEGKLYRSGDLARWLPDGNLEYLGRIDDQIKIRGFRIELGDIDTAIRSLPEITDCAVIAKNDSSGEKAIYAYFVSDEKLRLSYIRDGLREILPEYMIPSYMMQIDEIKITANGKLDRRALPEISVDSNRDYVAPTNEIEAKIVGVFEEILGVDRVGINDNFFEMGGHSLRATKVINRIEAETGVRLSLKAMFAAPTAEALGKLVLEEKGDSYEPIPVADKKSCYPMSAAQKRIFVINEIEGGGTTYNIPVALDMTGRLDVARVQSVFDSLIARHEALRTSFAMVDGEAVQIIADNVVGTVEYDKVSSADNEAKQKMLSAFVRPFDLSVAPLMRIKVVDVSENDTLLMFDMHHTISDGVSANLLVEEFIRLYNGLELPELRVQYKDYSQWLSQRDISSQKEYWVSQFEGEIPVLDMSTDFARPQYQSFNGSDVRCTLDKSL